MAKSVEILKENPLVLETILDTLLKSNKINKDQMDLFTLDYHKIQNSASKQLMEDFNQKSEPLINEHIIKKYNLLKTINKPILIDFLVLKLNNFYEIRIDIKNENKINKLDYFITSDYKSNDILQ